jgi:hypothetical protein
MTIAMAESDEAAVGGFLGALSGPRTKATAGIGFAKEGWYWRLVEFGHAVVSKGGARAAHRLKTVKAKQAAGYGFVKAHAFLRPAFDSGKDEATDEVADELRAALARYTPK